MKHEFSKELYIAYSFCEKCDNKEFIVDGQTQFCNQCGEMLFRQENRLYTLEKEESNSKKIEIYEKDKISFPQEIIVGYATCHDTLNGEEVVVKDRVICQVCKEIMTINNIVKYYLKDKQ